MGDLFLGLDCSTQSLSACLLDATRGSLLWEHSLRYGEALPQYGAPNGFLPLPPQDTSIVHAPPLLWLDALDMLFARMKEANLPLAQIRGIAGSGQQHGSVYLNRHWGQALSGLDPASSLAAQLAKALARSTAPIWMDSSTEEECGEIEGAAGGADNLAALTGSAAYPRFTGPQIRAFYKRDPGSYTQTSHVALVSSFLASVLAGTPAPIEYGDATGMNLLDIQRRDWEEDLLHATAPDLRKRLPPPASSDKRIGLIHPYFVAKYGFSPQANICVWSGDNPCSLIGTGLYAPGDVAISLGTSDTCFGLMQSFNPPPAREGHVFIAPTGGYMTLLCFQNGSLARERIRDMFGLDWAGFNTALESNAPGNQGRILLPWFVPEIVPHVEQAGIRRIHLSAEDVSGHCRGVVEAQMLSMKIHSTWMNITPRRILATGGASRNTSILQVMADVHACPVYPSRTGNTASLGAALRSIHAIDKTPWSELSKTFCAVDPPVLPREENFAVYHDLAQSYARAEREALHR